MRLKKSNKANLEKKRGIFFQIGFIVSLSIVLLAFEWTTIRTNDIEWANLGKGIVDEELAINTIHKEKKPEMPKPQIIRPIEAVTNEIEPDDNIEISIEVTERTLNNLNFEGFEDPDEVAEEPQIFFSAEQQPEFPGGLSAMYKYLYEKIKYPESAKQVGIQGPVHISFIVWNDGSIRDVRVLRGIGGGCDEEALRVIKGMPKWMPGMQRTKAVNVQMSIPILFNLMN